MVPEIVFSVDGCEIWHGDSVLYPYRRGEFDHEITDPPYSPDVHKRASTMRGGSAGKNDLGFEHLSPLLRASVATRAALANSWSLIFTDNEAVGEWRDVIRSSGGEYVRSLAWVRWSMPQLSGDRPPQGHESVVLAHPGGTKVPWNGPGNMTHLDHKCMRGKAKHKTQKSLEQMLTLVAYFTEPGAAVIDPCCGSGTTALACRILGRRCVAIESNLGWAKRAATRLGTALEKRDLDSIDAFIDRMESDSETKRRVKGHTTKVRAKRQPTITLEAAQ